MKHTLILLVTLLIVPLVALLAGNPTAPNNSPAAPKATLNASSNVSVNQLITGFDSDPAGDAAVLVTKGGKILYEKYWGNFRRDYLVRLAAENTASPKTAVAAPKPLLREEAAWVNVSQGLGIPLGTIGSGYSVFGKYGFVRLNFDGEPDVVPYNPKIPGTVEYFLEPEKKSTFGFLLTVGDKTYVLQQTKAEWNPAAIPVDQVACYAYLPKGVVTFAAKDLDLRITVSMFSPLIAHDLNTSTLPVQIFDVTVENPS